MLPKERMDSQAVPVAFSQIEHLMQQGSRMTSVAQVSLQPASVLPEVNCPSVHVGVRTPCLAALGASYPSSHKHCSALRLGFLCTSILCKSLGSHVV